MTAIKPVAKEDMQADYQVFAELYQNTNNEDEGFVNIDTKELDELVSAFDVSCEIYQVLQTTLDSGKGFDSTTAQVTKIALESLYRNLSVKRNKELFLSVESFDNSFKRVSASRLSLENMFTDIVKIIYSILKFINKIWEKTKAFLITLSPYKDRAIKRLKELYTEMREEMKRSSAKSDTLSDNISNEDNSIVTPLMRRIPFGIKGKCDFHTAQSVVESTSLLVRSNREILAHITKCLSNIAEDADVEDSVAEVDALVSTIIGHVSKLKLHSKKIDGNKVDYVYGYLIAGKLLELREYVGKSHDEQQRKVFNIDVVITDANYRDPYVPETLTRIQMEELTGLAIKLVEQSKDLDKVIPIMQKMLDKANEHFSDQSKIQNPQVARTAILVVKDLMKYTSQNLPKLSLDSNRVAGAVENYVRDSIAQYKGV